MNVSSFFERLGAPLTNKRWSWGSIRDSDNTVFLKVWQDRKFVENRKTFMMLTHHEKYADDPENIGYKERLRHVDLVRGGAKCYLIMCVAEDVHASARKIKDFNYREVFVGGNLIEIANETYVKIIDRLPVDKVKYAGCRA